MKALIFLSCLTIFAGCCTTKPSNDAITPPQLLEISQLPSVPETIYSPNFVLNTEMLVGVDGSVSNVKLLSSSGDKNWDSLAVVSIERWKFSPARLNEKPIPQLIRRKIRVKFATPVYMHLSEILCRTFDYADSAYQALKTGEDFSKVAEHYSIESSNNMKASSLGKVDIYRYPEEIQDQLMKLGENEFTEPISYGENYIIFKRVGK